MRPNSKECRFNINVSGAMTGNKRIAMLSREMGSLVAWWEPARAA